MNPKVNTRKGLNTSDCFGVTTLAWSPSEQFGLFLEEVFQALRAAMFYRSLGEHDFVSSDRRRMPQLGALRRPRTAHRLSTRSSSAAAPCCSQPRKRRLFLNVTDGFPAAPNPPKWRLAFLCSCVLGRDMLSVPLHCSPP
jgi:hypothetical protein